jgi:hypothetical protein
MDCYFDTYWQLRCPTQADKISEMIAGIFKENRLDVSRLRDKIGRDLWSNLFAKHSNDIEKIREVVNEVMSDTDGSKFAEWMKLLDDTRPRLRIMCCSRDATSPAMWSHYAQAHEGLVLQIEVDKIGLPDKIIHGNVKYSKRLPDVITVPEQVDLILYDQPIEPRKMIEAWVLNKGKEWEYEKEYRIAFTEPGINADYTHKPYRTESITSVFLGCRCCSEIREQVMGIAKGWPGAISVFSAKLHPTSFLVNHDSELLFRKDG